MGRAPIAAPSPRSIRTQTGLAIQNDFAELDKHNFRNSREGIGPADFEQRYSRVPG